MTYGQAMTVLGAINPEDLGITLMHEHVYCDMRRLFEPKGNATPEDITWWTEKLTLENLHVVREAGPIADNYVLDDEVVAIEELEELKIRGGGTLVDLTPIGVGRDPLALRRVADATGLNIVMGTGWYREMFHPSDFSQRSINELADEMIHDLAVGVADTKVRAGIIGEIGIHVNDPDGGVPAAEIKCLRAAAKAARFSGAAVSIHMFGGRRARLQVIDILKEEGVGLDRVVLCHSDLIADDTDLLIEQLEQGVYVEFDLLGRVEAVPIPSRSAAVPDAILNLCATGWTEKLLLSQDFCMKWHLKHWGGSGRSWLLTRFIPYLSSIGVTGDQLETIMVKNPRALLTLVKPLV